MVRETRVARVGKGVLWGNGDYPETDPGAELVLEDCIVRDIGRRAPEAQDGVRVLMRRCVIRNWGVRSRFTVRAFAAWAHDGASIRAEDCVFWQDRFLQAGLRGAGRGSGKLDRMGLEPAGPESPTLAPAGRVPRPDRQPGRHGQCRPLL